MTLFLAIIFIFIILIILVSRFKFILFFNLKREHTFNIMKICSLHIQHMIIQNDWSVSKLFTPAVIVDYRAPDFLDSFILWTFFFFFLVGALVGHAHSTQKFSGQGLNLCHSSENTGSLICWATRELLISFIYYSWLPVILNMRWDS